MTTVNIDQTGIALNAVGEDFEMGWGESADEYREYNGMYTLPISVSFPSVSRKGFPTKTDLDFELSVPTEDAEATLKALRSIPSGTPVKFGQLTFTAVQATTQGGRSYIKETFAASGLEPIRSARQAPAPAPAQG